jgi:hypothetical protein
VQIVRKYFVRIVRISSLYTEGYKLFMMQNIQALDQTPTEHSMNTFHACFCVLTKAAVIQDLT